MLRPHPAVLRRLVDEYRAVSATEPADGTRPGPRARDLAYTLCVSTGTRDVRAALETARRWLSAVPEYASATPGHEPVPVAAAE
ncbi:DUF5133 domain-containing protein [Streptomyces sp. S.PNR 29]|uniref:DUF5133 domain-containing protein n=1 Tax=Streptomyces sp. S.PNR 29 TaxID=2973805 RepID=UPI0025AEFE2F|nr:DUF5133 domain-containing protein [Streptomyces sp. S.PNR 29]MDN0198991.1 DUF5133 domain-containing protein [Streptomyces sp. S.PNR 29]